MPEKITLPQVVGALKATISKLEGKKEELDRLDSPIGDGDHGRTMVNAFHNIAPFIESMGEDIGEFLGKVGKTLALSGGAAAGPLYGTAFMEAGRVVEGKSEVGLKEIAEMAKAFEEGVIRRGKANVGEKTMLDTIHPAVESVEGSLSEGLPLKEALLNMKEAARKGMESTRDLISQRGRSSRLGERSIGHIDPGAASCYFILEAMVDFLMP
jgi:dihydroxyacetone kinase-like protein